MSKFVIATCAILGIAGAAPAYAFPPAILGQTDVPSAVNHGNAEQQAQATKYTGQRYMWQQETNDESKRASSK